jgi:hypothetical protein
MYKFKYIYEFHNQCPNYEINNYLMVGNMTY